jgi:hypothetical protein
MRSSFEQSATNSWSWVRSAWMPGTALGVGLFFLFHPMIVSGFRFVQTDAGDPRLNAYFLEHLWKCLGQAPGKRSLWNPGFGYPAKNIFAYSDTLISFEPFYAPWRALGLSPFSAYQAWLITVATLNFVAFYALLRSFFGHRPSAASVGAFIFAFAVPRLAQMGHSQILPQFYVVMLLWAVCALARSTWQGGGSPWQRSGFIILAGAALVAQFYGGFYLAYFSALLILFALIWALALTAFRQPLLRLIREQWIVLGASLTASGLVLWPLLSRYLWVATQLNNLGRCPRSALPFLPRLTSYLYVTGWSSLYGWMDATPGFRDLPIPGEHTYGFGLLTTGVMIAVLWRRRQQPGLRLAFLAAVTAFLLLTTFPFDLRLWNVAYHVLPGIKAMRAIARIGLLLLIPAGMAVASFVHHGAARRTSGVGVIMLALLCCLEQFGTAPSFDKFEIDAHSQALAARVDPNADAFLYVGFDPQADWVQQQLDAMWAQQICGIRTVNVYSGSLPPGYPFLAERVAQGQADSDWVLPAFRKWSSDPENKLQVQVIQARP